MSKSKKQVTNEKRARRLGSGEGIAPARPKGGGIPAWAWLVSGSVLIAAVVIAVVLITRGGGGSSGGQNASCVQQRLSTQKLDPASEPTWPANYDNLQCALTALGLKPSAESQSAVHYHVHLTIYVDGKKIVVPDNIGLAAAGGMSSTATSEIHTHDRNTDPVPGILHIESPNPGFQGTLLEFFDVWGVQATSQCLGGYCDGVKIWINGKPDAAGLNTKLVKHDAVTVVVGSPPAGFTPDKSFSFPNGE